MFKQFLYDVFYLLWELRTSEGRELIKEILKERKKKELAKDNA
jgi:hypothetical protein